MISMKAVIIWYHAYFSAFDVDGNTPTLAKFEESMLNERLSVKQLELVVFKLYKQFEQKWYWCTISQNALTNKDFHILVSCFII